MSIFTSALTAGTNNYQTTSEMINRPLSDLVRQGVVGAITPTVGGNAPMTGSFAINAQSTPDTTVAVTAGTAYVSVTPASQAAQVVSVKMDANQNVTIASNSSGSTVYDWIYLKTDATLANNPDANGTTVTTLFTSRSTSSSADTGTPPTYGLLLAVVTVANNFVTITNPSISDRRGTAPLTFGPTLFGATSGLAGPATPSVTTSAFKMQAGSVVGTTNGGGNLQIVFPTPFPNGLLTVIVTNGDGTTGSVLSLVASDNNVGHFSIVSNVFSGGIRVNWIAIGW